MHRELILGGPGCGKTTRLLDIVGDFLEQGIPPSEIAYVAFTRKAAQEAKQRACQKFGFKDKELPFFRTLHSFAFKELGLSAERLMNDEHYAELGAQLKVKFGEVRDDFGMMTDQGERGSQWYSVEQQARLRLIPLRNMALTDGRVNLFQIRKYHDALVNYKRAKRVLDYTDILEEWLVNMFPLPVQVLIVDEAQDLSPLQWKLIHRMEENVPHVYYAGDDDQAIYEWAGADINHFLSLKASRTVLPVSYRLPKQVFTKCNQVVSRIKNRYAKDWRPTERNGLVTSVPFVEKVPLGQGQWMVLSRNQYHLDSTLALLRTRGLHFEAHGKSSLSSTDARAARAWQDAQLCEFVAVSDLKKILAKFPKSRLKIPKETIIAMADTATITKEILRKSYGIDLAESWEEALDIRPHEKTYLKAVMRNEGSLTGEARIKVSTIHSVKGGEADNVLLLADMSAACHDSFLKRPDAESRVFYVGCSRAKEQLVLCQPQTSSYFPL